VGKISAVRLSWKEGLDGGFVDGSNWVTIAANGTNTLALKSDGSLWSIAAKSNIHQVGSDHDWKKIASIDGISMSVKQNGTLWGWGDDCSYYLLVENGEPDRNCLSQVKIQPNQFRSFSVKNPIRIGSDADWDNVFLVNNDGSAVGIKRDGSVWIWGQPIIGRDGWRRLENKPVSLCHMNRLNMDGTNWISLVRWGDLLWLRADGTLWDYGRGGDWEILGQYIPKRSGLGLVQVGTKSDWTDIQEGNFGVTALDSKGRLFWCGGEWHSSKYTDWLAATPARGGNYTDLLVGTPASGALALAKDGTLVCWTEGVYIPDHPTFWENFYLGPSRRPVFTANIFDFGK